MARRKSFLDRLRASSSRALIGLADGPLTFGGRRDSPAIVKKGRRKTRPDDLQRRLILTHQIGQLPDLLVGHLPRLSTQHSFTLDEAASMAAELDVTIFHLISAGAVVDGLSDEDLAAFVSEQVSALATQDDIAEREIVHASPPSRAAPPQKSRPATSGDATRDEIDRLLREAADDVAPGRRSRKF